MDWMGGTAPAAKTAGHFRFFPIGTIFGYMSMQKSAFGLPPMRCIRVKAAEPAVGAI